MNEKKNRIHPGILPVVFGLFGAIIASGNKDTPILWVGLILGALLGIYVTARINSKT
jgi:uncharacterized membrane protein YfcA